MTYDKTFVNKLAQEALVVDVSFNDYWVKVNCEENICKFISDIITNKIKHYTKDDWNRICEEAKENTTYQNLFHHRGVPKWLFDNFATTMDAKYTLLRDDLLPAEIQQQVNRLTPHELESFIKKERGRIPPRVVNFLANLPIDKLREINFIPLNVIYQDLPLFSHIQSNFEKLYEGEETAMTAIADNEHISDEARKRAFDAGCNMFTLQHPSESIAKNMYECFIETITDYDEDTHPKYLSAIHEKLSDMIQNNTLPYACQIDLVERLLHDEVCESCYGWLTRALATDSRHDSVLAILSAPFNKPVLEIIADNPYAGKETFFTFSDKSKDDEEAKFYLIKFLSHKEKLDDESIINGFKLGDHELCKVLAGFHGDIINQNKPLQEDYKFYCSLNEELRKLYPDCNRWKSIMATMLRINYEQSTAGTPKRLDSVGAPFISYGDLLEIISGTEPLSCISVEEEQNLRRMCGELKRQYRNSNILKQIKQFESQLSIIAKQEEFRRQNKSFFSQKKDMDYKAGDEYRFNTSHMLRASDEEINTFIKNIKKINNPNLLKLLTINLVRDSVDIIPSEGQHSCLLIAKKFSPIYNAMENRINKLEHSWVNKLGASEKEEMR